MKAEELMESRKQNRTQSNIKKMFNVIFKTFKFLFKFSLLAGIIVSLCIGFYITKTVHELPKVTEDIIKNEIGGTSNMFATDGTIIWSDTEHRRDYITIDKVPQKYKDLLLATEDNEYYTNPGFSPKGLINAIITKGARGGSGIEQQLIKNVFFSTDSKDRTIDRKIKEIWLALKFNQNFEKDKMLEWYINLINMGEGSYGANTIAITYYGTSLADMTGEDEGTISRLAIIAGLGQAPSTYNLYDNPKAVEKRRNEVLLSAYNHKRISKDLYKKAKAVPVQDGLKERFWRNTEVVNQGNQHSAYISSALQQIKDLGYELDKTPMQIYTGLNPQVNLDVKYIFDNFYSYQDEKMQSAGTFIDPNTGFVMAQYGGRYSQAFGLNRATQNTRSSGSSTKPFISYGPSIQYFGKGSGTILDSSNYVYPGTNFVAHNYGGYTYGNITMTRALKLSLNTPAIRLLDNVVGSDYAKKFLKGLNMDVLDSYGGQDALGINISTQQLAAAHATLANMGTYKTPQYITKIVFNDNSEKQVSFNSKKVMNDSTAYILLRMMEEVPKPGGTARGAETGWEGYAVKTGTVGYDSSYGFPDNTASDLWIGGTTKSVSMALWLGYDTPYELGNQIYESPAHSLLFKDLMLYFNNGKDTSQWEQPKTVIGNNVENLFPTDSTQGKSSQYDIPELNDINSSLFTTLSKSISSKIEDEGFDKYKDPTDYEEIMNWKLNADLTNLSWFEQFNGDPLRAILSNENAYYNIPSSQ